MESAGRKKRIVSIKRDNITAGEKSMISSGHYYCDYSPRYQKAYHIYEKAKRHMRQLKSDELKK